MKFKIITQMTGALVVTLGLSALLSGGTAHALSCTSTSSGNWSSASTWVGCGGAIPTSGDSVTIASGHSVTVDTTAVAANLTLGPNTSASGNIVSINPGQTLSVAGNVSLETPTAGTTDLAVGAGTLFANNIAINGGTFHRAATVSVSTGTVAVAGNISFAGKVSNARYTSTGASHTKVGGNFGAGGTLTTSGTGEIIFDGSSHQTIGSYQTYNDIVIANTNGGVAFANTTTIGGKLTVTTGTLDIGAVNLTVKGTTSISSNVIVSSTIGLKAVNDLTVESTGSLTLTASEGLTLNGDLVVNGTITGHTGTWSFQKPGGGTISGTAPDLRLIAATLTFTTNYSINMPVAIGKLAVNGSTLTNNSTLTASVDLTGTGQLKQGPGSELNIGNSDSIASLDATALGNTVHYIRTMGPQTVRPITYYNLSIDKPAQVATLGGPASVQGNLAVTAGKLEDGGYTITGTASGILSVNAGAKLALGTASIATSFPSGFTTNHVQLDPASTVIYNSDQPQTISSLPVYGNLRTASTTAVTKDANGNVVVKGSFINGTNNTFDNGTQTVTVSGDSIMQGPWVGNGILLLQNGTTTHTIKGRHANIALNDPLGAVIGSSVAMSGDLVVANGTLDTNNHSVKVMGTASLFGKLLLSGTNGTQTYNTIQVKSSGQLAFTAAEDITINGDLTVDGAITGATGEWKFRKNNGVISGSAALVTINGAATFNRNYTITVPLTIQTISVDGSRTVKNQSTVTVNNSLTGNGSFTQTTGALLGLKGATTIASLLATVTNNTVAYTGSGSQLIKPVTYYNLDLSGNTSQLVTTANGTDVTNNLALGATKLTVTSGDILLEPSAAVTRTTGYIIGKLEKKFTTSSFFSFPLGDASNYAPIDLLLSGVSTSGSVTGTVTANKQSDTLAGLALLDPAKGVKRTWSLKNNGMSFTNYNTTLHFVASDVDAGTATNQMTVVAGSNGGSWNQLASTCAALLCNASGQTLADFQAGITLASTTPVTPGTPPPSPAPTPSTIVSTFGATTTTAGIVAPATTTGGTGTGGTTAPTPNPTVTPLFDVGAELSSQNQAEQFLIAILIGLAIGAFTSAIVIGIRNRIRHNKGHQQ